MGAENSSLANHMKLLRNASHNGYMGGKSTHNTRIDGFGGSETQRSKSFLKQFRNLESLGILKNWKIDIWSLNLVQTKETNDRIEEMMICFNKKSL